VPKQSALSQGLKELIGGVPKNDCALPTCAGHFLLHPPGLKIDRIFAEDCYRSISCQMHAPERLEQSPSDSSVPNGVCANAKRTTKPKNRSA